MHNAQITSQVEKLINQIGGFASPSGDRLLHGSNTMLSIIFGYKLMELAMVSLCVTVKSKGLLPSGALAADKQDFMSYAEILFEFGLIDQDIFHKAVRLKEVQPEIQRQARALSSSMQIYKDVLIDINTVLKGTETIVSEMCDNEVVN